MVPGNLRAMLRNSYVPRNQPGVPAKMQIPVQFWGGAQEPAFLTHSHMLLLLLLVQGPHFQNHCAGELSNVPLPLQPFSHALCCCPIECSLLENHCLPLWLVFEKSGSSLRVTATSRDLVSPGDVIRPFCFWSVKQLGRDDLFL